MRRGGDDDAAWCSPLILIGLAAPNAIAIAVTAIA